MVLRHLQIFRNLAFSSILSFDDFFVTPISPKAGEHYDEKFKGRVFRRFDETVVNDVLQIIGHEIFIVER